MTFEQWYKKINPEGFNSNLELLQECWFTASNDAWDRGFDDGYRDGHREGVKEVKDKVSKL